MRWYSSWRPFWGDTVRFVSQETASVCAVECGCTCNECSSLSPAARCPCRCLLHRLHADRIHSNCDGDHFHGELFAQSRKKPVYPSCIEITGVHVGWSDGRFCTPKYWGLGRPLPCLPFFPSWRSFFSQLFLENRSPPSHSGRLPSGGWPRVDWEPFMLRPFCAKPALWAPNLLSLFTWPRWELLKGKWE